ncbi:hypothetical protein MUCCIDRAFT_110630 [Mucor lusitanicus CBS 277.49]|uniref:Uncharacterized protein n=1 Tax=Mucor lusitanicus CBS 277.49 TaxID=747725 RepID=A0A168LNA5_MUCCL|nr:hypothetical protein MUCCIDRAFT_110630 [Mucor lusitanicus CBS 277.49]
MSAANDNPEPQRASRRQRSRRQNENTPPLRRPRRARNLVDITDNLRFNETDHLFEKNVDYDPASPNYCRHVMQPMNMVCPDCNALLFSKELLRGKFSMCCAQGKVQLEPLPDPPQPLRALLTERNEESRHFRDEIRAYNNSFAFTSLGGTSGRKI